MKVQLAHPYKGAHPGAVVELPDREARGLIRDGLARSAPPAWPVAVPALPVQVVEEYQAPETASEEETTKVKKGRRFAAQEQAPAEEPAEKGAGE